MIQVTDTRPPSLQQNFNDVSSVPKYVMPESEYEARKDSVLAWKKAQKLGRFDPNTPDVEEQKIRQLERDVEERGMFDVHEERRLPTSSYIIQLCSGNYRFQKDAIFFTLFIATLHQPLKTVNC
jgi:tubulin-folding cofactor B